MKSKENNGYIYLIGEIDNPNHYKIGLTRNKDINKRLKKLQTGSSGELYIRYSFFSNHVTKLEKMLHRHYNSVHSINEWFEINDDDAKDFIKICEKYQNIINSLKENPYF